MTLYPIPVNFLIYEENFIYFLFVHIASTVEATRSRTRSSVYKCLCILYDVSNFVPLEMHRLYEQYSK
jgi:hypothetical protein